MFQTTQKVVQHVVATQKGKVRVAEGIRSVGHTDRMAALMVDQQRRSGIGSNGSSPGQLDRNVMVIVGGDCVQIDKVLQSSGHEGNHDVPEGVEGDRHTKDFSGFSKVEWIRVMHINTSISCYLLSHETTQLLTGSNLALRGK